MPFNVRDNNHYYNTKRRFPGIPRKVVRRHMPSPGILRANCNYGILDSLMTVTYSQKEHIR